MNNKCDRRSFLKTSALVSLCLLSESFIQTPVAKADNSTQSETNETYHVFIPLQLARYGGEKTITLKSGEDCTFKIPANLSNNSYKIIANQGIDGNDIKIVLHTAYGDSYWIREEINKAVFLLNEPTINKCQYTYSMLQNGEYVSYSDLALLDYLINSSKIDEYVIQRYQITSEAYKISLIENRLNSTLQTLDLPEENKKALKATFQYVKALEAIPNFDLLDQLDLIIAEQVVLPLELKGLYAQAGATSRAYLADLLITNSLNTDETIPPWIKEVYNKVINGAEILEEDKYDLQSLTRFIVNSDLPKNAKIVYLTAVEESNNKLSEEEKNNLMALFDQKEDLQDAAEEAWNHGKKIGGKQAISWGARALTSFGVEAGTGATLTSLAGGAATNATLAALGGGAVSAGGLGMLGGLAVVTGGAALIGAAGILSFAVISEMDGEDFANLTIAGITGTLAGAGAVGAVWLAASTFGVASGLSGAAFISSMMAAMGGLSVMTGGASLVAFAVGVGVWSLLQNNKKRDNHILQQLETVSYALTEEKTTDPIALYIENQFKQKDYVDQFYIAPQIALDKLTNAMKTYAKNINFNPDEKIVALLDTSFWNDSKEGIILTTERAIWRTSGKNHNKKYEYIYNSDADDIASGLYDEIDEYKLANLLLNLKQEKSKLSRA